MPELGFRLEPRPHSPGHTAFWLVHDSRLERLATEEEVKLWQALEQALRQLQERPVKKR